MSKDNRRVNTKTIIKLYTVFFSEPSKIIFRNIRHLMIKIRDKLMPRNYMNYKSLVIRNKLHMIKVSLLGLMNIVPKLHRDKIYAI